MISRLESRRYPYSGTVNLGFEAFFNKIRFENVSILEVDYMGCLLHLGPSKF